MKAIIRQTDASFNVEILLVDDGSTDGSTDDLPDDVELLKRPHLGKGATVRAGLEYSTSEWTLFTDIDWSVPVETVYQLIMTGLEIIIRYYHRL